MDFLSDLELAAIADRLNHLIGGMFINNIYSPDEYKYSFLLKGEHASSINVNLKIGIWLSDRYLKERSGTEFLAQLRRFAEGRRVGSLRAVKGERIIFLNLGGGNIIFEFFGNGNLICTDEEMIISCALREEEFKSRSITAGQKYILPKPRGNPLSDLAQLPYNEDVPLAKHMAYNWSISRKLMNEIFFMSNVDSQKSASKISDDEKGKIMNSLKQIIEQINQSDAIYEYKNDETVYSLIKLGHLSQYQETKYEGLLDGLKQAFDKYIFEIKDLNQERVLKQQELERQYLERATLLRQLASAIMQYNSESVKDLISKLNAEIKSDTIIINGKTLKGATPAAIASEIYREAKSYEEGAKRLRKSASKISVREKRQIKYKEVINREWYEKYRWFITSNELLAVGGRDSSSNEALLKKIMKPNDLVFHTEIQGSPFFLIPNNADEKSIMEVATATASFSRAWRAGLSSADVYYVTPEQVKFSAPSGEFLPKGGAILVGQKNYIRGVKLQLGMGLVEIKSSLKVFSAPLQSASVHCRWFVEIIPGRLQQSEAAKKISKMLMSVYETVPPVEEFQKALPAGNSDIVGIRKMGDIK
ncbi:MAG: NFACT family protein [Nitrososphaerota archaeon]|nr:NFACT family protein [Nitrososphaerota archaeon]MDG6930681.1 NFACT family protein [Nitrososphaerota archaeon]